jgi:hypothetical protein
MFKRAILATFVLLAAVADLGMVSRVAAQTSTIDLESQASSVKNRTYDVWVSPSFISPPFVPFHDCFRFTASTLCIDQCGGCGPLFEVPRLGIWQARVSCGGLNLVFIGTSLSGPAKEVLGGSGIGRAEGTNFGVEGVENADCSLSPANLTGATPYSNMQ